MARPKAADHDLQRVRILSAAVSAFASVGYPSASMAQLALACGTSKAGLYHYYVSKEALLFDALNHYTLRLLQLGQSVVARGLSADQTLQALIRTFLAEYRSAHDYHVALLNDVKFLAVAQRDQIRDQERAVVQVFAKCIGKAYPKRARDQAMLMATTMALLGMINFTFAWLRAEGPLSDQQFADLVIDLWQRGLTG